MAKHLLHKHQRPKASPRALPKPTLASSSKQQLIHPRSTDDEESVLTLPLEVAVVSPPGRETVGSSFLFGREMTMGEVHEQLDLHDDNTTLTNDFSSVNFEIGSEDNESVQSFSFNSTYSHRSKSRIDAEIIDARQSSLLDADSSLGDESSFSRASRQSSRQIIQQQSRLSQRSRQSRLSMRPSQDDRSWIPDASHHGDEKDKKSIDAKLSISLQDDTWDQMPSDIQDTEGVNGPEEPEDPEWSEQSVNGDKKVEIQNGDNIWPSTSSISSASKSTSSVARVRKKWRAHRRIAKRNVKWNAEEDWCTGEENEDWPGAAPQPRGPPSTILEEEEYSTEPASAMPAQQPRRIRWFGCFG